MRKVKMLVYSSYLGSGGAEKHTVRILNQFPEELFDILIVTADQVGEYESKLKNNIKLEKVGSKSLYKLSSSIGRISTYWGLKKNLIRFEPDIILSIQDLQNALILRLLKNTKSKAKLVLMVQNSVKDAYSNTKNWVHRAILKSIKIEYHLADKVIALSEGVKKGLLDLNSKLIGKIEVIYNAGLDDEMLSVFDKVSKEENEPLILVSCGRLTYQKGYPYMFKSLKLLKDKGIEFNYQILGKGSELEELKNLARELNISDSIKFLGFQDNPYQYIIQADVFVLPSLYEGFGNVIVEALACGTAVVSTDCPHGPNEILKNGEYGMLVPIKEPKILADAIEKMITDSSIRKSYEEKGKERANDFHSRIIGTQYYKSILNTVNK